MKRKKRAGEYTRQYGWVDTDACEVYCEKCARGFYGPKFETTSSLTQDRSEVDSPNHCSNCAVLLPNGLTDYGATYVLERVTEGQGDAKILALWREQFFWIFPDEDAA